MQRRRLALLALSALLGAACGGRGDASNDQASEEENVSVGEGLLDTTTVRPPTTTTPTQGSAPGASGGPSDPAAVPPSTAKGPANVSVRDDPSGFRLRLTVGDHVRFSTAAVIPLQLTYENRTTRVLVVDTDPRLSFVIRDKAGTDRWRDSDCRTQGATGDDTPGYGLAPGEQAELAATYPYDERFGRAGGAFDASSCKLPAGQYDVFGVVEWCAADQPTDSGPNAANACADGTTKLVMSTPVSIELLDT